MDGTSTENLSFSDCLKAQQEIIAILSNTDHHTKPFEQLQSIWREIKSIRESQQQQIKNLVKAWQDYESEEASKTTCGEDAAQILSEEKNVQGEVTQAKLALSKAQEEYDSIQQNVDKCRTELDQLVEERKKVQKETTESLPKARYDVNLYINITNIRWQFDCEPEEIKGYVCNKTDVKPFSLNSKQVSKFFTANYLWDLIEEDW